MGLNGVVSEEPFEDTRKEAKRDISIISLT